MKKDDIIDELAERTGFFKKNIRDMMDALSNLIEEQLLTAEFDQDSELVIVPGIVICGKRVPDRMVKDPRDNSDIVSPEKVIPYANFKQSIRKKLRKEKKGRKNNV